MIGIADDPNHHCCRTNTYKEVIHASTTNDELSIIQSLWIGGELSVMERLCISSFLNNGHEFHLYTYGDVKKPPKGTIIKDASEIINSEKIFKYKDRDSYAGFSNVFRYKLLLEKGNYWVDTDVVCMRPFKNSSDYVFARAKRRKFFGPLSNTFRVQSCVIKTPPGSEIMNYCYEISKSKNPQELEWGEIGPRLLRSAVKKFGMESFVSGSHTFCPIDWPDWERFLNGSLLIFWKEWIKMHLFKTQAVHLWNEMWRENKIDKNAAFPKNSIYEQLKRKYLTA